MLLKMIPSLKTSSSMCRAPQWKDEQNGTFLYPISIPSQNTMPVPSNNQKNYAFDYLYFWEVEQEQKFLSTKNLKHRVQQ